MAVGQHIQRNQPIDIHGEGLPSKRSVAMGVEAGACGFIQEHSLDAPPQGHDPAVMSLVDRPSSMLKVC